MTGLAGFTNAFLVLYAVDAGLSLVEELLRATTGSTALLGLRNLVALPVVLAAIAGLPLLALTPRLPWRVLLPMFLSVLWLSYGAIPLPLWIAPADLGLFTSALQCGFARLGFGLVRRHNTRRGEDSWWWLGDASVPDFSPGHTLGMVTAGVFVGVPLLFAYSLAMLVTLVQVGTREFVSFDREGILLADRHYARDDREIRLVGMMHLGERSGYREIVESFAEPGTVVLQEGVTDDTGRLANGLGYDGVASALGLEAQDELPSYVAPEDGDAPAEWPVWRHADVDLATFSDETIEWLEWSQSIWAADDWATALGRILRGASDDPKLLESIERDVFTARNDALLAHLDTALEEFARVVVPWGALHLPAIEAEILEDGFTLGEERRRRLLSWATVREALAERAAAEAERAAAEAERAAAEAERAAAEAERAAAEAEGAALEAEAAPSEAGATTDERSSDAP